MSDRWADAPKNHEVGAIANLAEGRARTTAALGREHGGQGGVRGQAGELRAEPVGDRDALALRLTRQIGGDIDQHLLGGGENARRIVEGDVERYGARAGDAARRHAPVAKPGDAARTGALGFDDASFANAHGDVVACAAATEAGDVRGDRVLLGRHATILAAPPASIAPYTSSARRTSAA